MQKRELLEISDLIVDFDLNTLQRKPVAKAEAVNALINHGQVRASHVVQNLPDHGGILVESAVDELLIRVHCEMQRLSEEFQHGRRVLELLQHMLDAFAKSGVKGPFRIVDIGSGLGYVIRWLAAFRHELNHQVELVGVDFNEALVGKANALAQQEGLDCRFEVVNAFAMSQPATMFVSTGVLHHFRGKVLHHFFQQHDTPETQGFAHFDFQPTIFAKPGAWVFHKIRMRQPLSHHDGVVSAVRAHHARRFDESGR